MKHVVIQNIRNNIRGFLKNQDITTSKLERMSQLSNGTIGNLLSHKILNPSLTTIISLATAMEVLTSDLLERNMFNDSNDSNDSFISLSLSIINYLFLKKEKVGPEIDFVLFEKIYKSCIEVNNEKFSLPIAEIEYRKHYTETVI